MIFKAAGLRPHSPLFNATAIGARWYLSNQQKRASRLAA
jgi:hypothetical protein